MTDLCEDLSKNNQSNINDDDDYDEENQDLDDDQKKGQLISLSFNEIDANLNNQTQKEYNNDLQLNQDSEFYGINKLLYKKPDQNDINNMLNRTENSPKPTAYPPEPSIKTGTEFVLLPRSPEFILNSELFEPMYTPKQTILEESLRREIERICFADSLINRVVYDCVDQSLYTKDIDPGKYDMDVVPFYIPQSQEDITLVFESRFESGNLRRAIQICDYEYNLILKPDYFTTGHTQWYYFSVSNTRKNVEYRFNIINMMKPDSLYNSGMKPLIYSTKKAKIKKLGWYRDGHDVCYYQNNMKRKNAGFYYTLTFAVKFPYDCDCVYFAHCYPYTYSQLCRYIRLIENDPVKKHRVKRKTLCQTIAGNNCDYLIIGDFNNQKDKKGIMLTSRVHPGETMASYVIEYVIDFLLGNSPIARVLRENFVFKIIPMLNVDGVLNGNYRCGLAGVDLNRQYVDPSKKLHPTILATKQLLKQFKEEKDVLLYCDFHGHSRNKNIFMYGCAGKDPSKKEQIFPLLMRNNCNVFSFKDCSFQIQKDREGSARIALWKEFNILNCYTLEISFCGADIGKYEYFHFNQDIYKEMAQSFCQSIIDCFEPEQLKVQKVQEEIEQMILKNDNKKDGDKQQNSDDEDSDYSNEDQNDNAQYQQQQQQQQQQQGNNVVNTNNNNNNVNNINLKDNNNMSTNNNLNNPLQSENLKMFPKKPYQNVSSSQKKKK